MTLKLLQLRRNWMGRLLDLMVALCQRIDQGLLEREATIDVPDASQVRDPLMNLCHRISGLFQNLANAQQLFQDEMARMLDLYKERDQHAGQVRDLLKRFRGLVLACHGQEGLRAVGLVGRTPTEAEALAQQAEVTSGLLSEPKADLETASDAPAQLDTAKVIAGLRQGAQAIKRSIALVREAKLRKESAHDYRNELLAVFDYNAVHAARLLKSLCALTGQKDLARKVRRILREIPKGR